jgi:hypothetical protein
MTEQEAKKKWCPFVMEGLDEDPYSANRDINGKPMMGMCVGNDCMAWRWKNKIHGYCGLAGIP